MPSFPGSVFSAASRSAGQTIGSAHMNAVQDELNAITDGYLNGTARLNSSASTLASLDVNGNSTLASSITFGSIPYVMPSSGGSTGQVLTCVSTSGSTMGLEWRDAAVSSAVYARVNASTGLQVANDALTVVSFNNQRTITPASVHSTTTNPTRLTAPSSGMYVISGGVRWNSLSTGAGRAVLSIRLNGATDLVTETVGLAGTFTLTKNITTLYNLAATDYVELTVEQNSGSTGSLAVSANTSPEFSLARL